MAEFNVAGTTFDNRAAALSTLSKGDRVRLVPEPANPFDPCAVRVLTAEGALLGYVPKALTRAVMDHGVTHAFVAGVDADFPYVRLSVVQT
jgi:hypothetical protein